MAQKQKSVAEVVWGLAEPLAEEFGYFLWDVEFVREGSKRILRITTTGTRQAVSLLFPNSLSFHLKKAPAWEPFTTYYSPFPHTYRRSR